MSDEKYVVVVYAVEGPSYPMYFGRDSLEYLGQRKRTWYVTLDGVSPFISYDEACLKYNDIIDRQIESFLDIFAIEIMDYNELLKVRELEAL